MKNETTTNKALYQINSKGNKMLKIYGIGNEKEISLHLLKICKRAVSMEKKDGAKYLRTLGLSKNQPIFFNSFDSSILGSVRTLRIGDFLEKYSADTLAAILDEITNNSL